MNEDDDDELDIELPKLRETIRTRSQELKSARADAVRDAGDDEKAKAKAIDDNPVTINPLAFWTARLRNIAAEGIPTWCKLAKIGMLASPTSASAERAFSILQSMNKAGLARVLENTLHFRLAQRFNHRSERRIANRKDRRNKYLHLVV